MFLESLVESGLVLRTEFVESVVVESVIRIFVAVLIVSGIDGRNDDVIRSGLVAVVTIVSRIEARLNV